MKRLTLTLLFFALSLPALAHAQDPQPLEVDSQAAALAPKVLDISKLELSDEAAAAKQKVKVLLSGYEYFPTRDDLIAVSPDAALILAAIAVDDDELPATRNRALDALGYFEGDYTKAFFETLLDEPDRLKSTMIHHVVGAYARSQGEAAVEKLSPCCSTKIFSFESPPPPSWGSHGGVKAREVLKERLELETNKVVLKSIKQSM